MFFEFGKEYAIDAVGLLMKKINRGQNYSEFGFAPLFDFIIHEYLEQEDAANALALYPVLITIQEKESLGKRNQFKRQYYILLL